MKLTLLKKKLIKDFIIILVILAIVGAGAFFGTSGERSIKKELDGYKSETQNIRSSIDNQRQEYQETLEAFSIYDKIPKKRLPTKSGMSSTSSRLRAATPIITTLNQRYRFSELVPTFTVIEEDKSIKKQGSLGILTSSIKIRYSGLSDEMVFSFIYTLINQFPGYLQLKDIKMSRKGDITVEKLRTINTTKQVSPFVAGEMSFIWRALQGEAKKDNKKSSSKGSRRGRKDKSKKRRGK